MCRILIIDDHSLVRDGVRLLLRGLDSPPEVFEAGTCEEALQQLQAIEALDLILLDLSLPGASGLAGIPLFRAQRPSIPIIILSASESDENIKAALDAGASGFIPKSSIGEVVLSAIRLVLAGGVYIPHELVTGDTEDVSAPALPDRRVQLTPRQLEVLKLLAEGNPNKLIGSKLNMAESTVRVHTTAIFKVLEVGNRTEAALVATRLGLIPGKPGRAVVSETDGV